MSQHFSGALIGSASPEAGSRPGASRKFPPCVPRLQGNPLGVGNKFLSAPSLALRPRKLAAGPGLPINFPVCPPSLRQPPRR